MNNSLRILITGADGFVGLHLQNHLAKHLPDASLIPVAGPNTSTDQATLDVTDAQAVADCIAQAQPDHVVHLAAMAAVTASTANPDLAFQINTLGTMNVIRALEAHTPNARLIFASSSEIYGRSFQSGQALDETARLAPANPYAISKAAADLAVQEAANRTIKATIFRLFNHTGPGQAEAFVLPAFAAQIARIEAGMRAPILKVGNLAAERDFLDIEDVLGAYLGAIIHADRLSQCEVLNIASGQSRSIQSLLDTMLDATNTDITVELDPARLRPSDTPHARGNPTRANTALDWTPRQKIETTIARLLDYQRDQIKTASDSTEDP